MTQDDIIAVAKEADIEVAHMNKPMTDAEVKQAWLERFANIVEKRARKERTEELMQLFLDPENQPTQFGTATSEHREAEVLAEREICALVCEQMGALEALDGEEGNAAMVRVADKQADLCAAAIRERNEK